MKPKGPWAPQRWIVASAILLSAVGEAAAGELSGLSRTQREILAEVESRWWGWPSEPAPIVPAPKSWERLEKSWPISRRQEVVVLTGSEPSQQEAYIAEMLRRELSGKHHLPCRVVTSLDAASAANQVICLGTLQSNSQLAQLCRAKDIASDVLTQPESYVIDFCDDQAAGTRWVLVAGGDPAGCIHGGYSLLQLVRSDSEGAAIEACRVRDYPTVAVRSLRGVGESLGMKLQVHTESRYLGRKITADEIHPNELMLPCLDRLARNRINCYHILSGLDNGPKLPARMQHLVAESHRRGIKVVGGFRPVGAQQGDRSTFPCYSNEEQMQVVLGHFRQYIEAGCDFVYFMADDYYPDKYAGHCDKCIARFGGLAGEQVYVLHRIADLAHQLGMSNEQILFCPTHYDARSREDIEYLKAFNDDPKLEGIQFTFTYLTEDVIKQRKQSLANLHYALFYNGPRWLSYYYRQSPNTRGVLANYARNATYFPIYYGWHAAQYSPAEGWFVNTTEQVRRTFHEIIPRETKDTTLLGNIANYTDSIFKGPVEYALWGHYCWHPAAHDTRQSEVAIGESLFGPGNGRTLARLNRVLVDLTRVVYEDVTPPKGFLETLSERFHLARILHRQLKEAYEAYRTSVAPGYLPATQDFHARLGIEDIEKYIAKMEHVVEVRELLSGGTPGPTPSPRYAGVIFPNATPDAFLISGGCRGGDLTGCLGDLWKYYVGDDRWEQLEVPPGMTSPRCGHSAVTVGQRIYLFGGCGGSGGFLNDLYVYDPAADRWEKLVPEGEIPPPRGCPLPLSTDGQRIYLFSGAQSAAQYGSWINGDLYVYHIAQNTSAKLRSSIPW